MCSPAASRKKQTRGELDRIGRVRTYWCAEQVCAGLQELDCFLWAQTGALLRPNGTEPWTSAQALHLFGAYSTYLIQPAKITHLGPISE